MKIVNVVGARPNFIKIAPLMDEYKRHSDISSVLLHTGQHYDEKMSDLFFRQLGIPKPDINLGVGSGSHARQTAAIMTAFEDVLIDLKPDVLLVVGDVNSTIACGMTAVKLGIRLAHVEAGLRSFDRTMPEEINRILTDSISDLMFCTEQAGVDNLRHEGVAENKIHLVGNVMIDTLLKFKAEADKSPIKEDLGLVGREYALLTLHRPANVDDPDIFGKIVEAIEVIQQDYLVVFPIHPRTRNNLSSTPQFCALEKMAGTRIVNPLGYLDFLNLMSSSKLVLTDSGGIQEETTILGVPCLTLRENTERPVTVEQGSSRLVGSQTDKILAAYFDVKNGNWQTSMVPPLWDGKAAGRIVEILKKEFG